MARVAPAEFIRQVRVEASKISWPTRKETVQTTIMVLVMTLILAIFFLGIDQVLGRAIRGLLGAFQ
jgi:preprotein translocase subunit SecE